MPAATRARQTWWRYEARFYEGAYLLGVLAGRTTKTNTLGFVGSFPIPEVIRNIDAFTLGARSVNPKAHTKVVWVDTWYDPGKERQGAEALIAQGADVLCQNTDSPGRPCRLPRRKGLHAFGWDSDMAKYGPHAQLTANTENWGVYYIDEINKVLAGTWTGDRKTKWGIKEGAVVLSPLNAWRCRPTWRNCLSRRNRRSAPAACCRLPVLSRTTAAR